MVDDGTKIFHSLTVIYHMAINVDGCLRQFLNITSNDDKLSFIIIELKSITLYPYFYIGNTIR